MKKIVIVGIALLAGCGMSCPQAKAQSDEARNVTLSIQDRRGRPVPGVVVQDVKAETSAVLTDGRGMQVFPGMTDRDSLVVMLPRYGSTTIPVNGMDSIVIVLRSARRYSYHDQGGDKIINVGYGGITERTRTTPTSTLNVQEIVQNTGANSLYDVLVGRVSGLTLSRGVDGVVRANIRGINSIMAGTEPLVVLDGAPFGTLNDANNAINVRDVKTVDVLKEGSMYGSRGANGVILVTTK